MDFQNVRRYLERAVTEYQLPALDVIITQQGKERYRYRYNCESDSMYIGYSSTKVVIGAALAKLVCEGRLSLDSPACEFLPEMKNLRVYIKDEKGMIVGDKALAPEHPVCIRHLASMCSGVADNLYTDYISSAVAAGHRSTRDIVGAILREPLSFEPGTDYKYGLSLDVLAAIMEVATGMRLSKYLEDSFFKPLEMDNTTFHPDAAQRARLLPQYMWYPSGGCRYRIPDDNAFVFTEEYESGGAGLYFTADDYMKLETALANDGIGANGNRVLTPEAIERMRTPLLSKSNAAVFRAMLGLPGYDYGMCVRVMTEPEQENGATPVGEFGWQGKGGTYSSISPERHTAIFMGIQVCDHHPVNHVMHRQLREMIYGMLP